MTTHLLTAGQQSKLAQDACTGALQDRRLKVMSMYTLLDATGDACSTLPSNSLNAWEHMYLQDHLQIVQAAMACLCWAVSMPPWLLCPSTSTSLSSPAEIAWQKVPGNGMSCDLGGFIAGRDHLPAWQSIFERLKLKEYAMVHLKSWSEHHCSQVISVQD